MKLLHPLRLEIEHHHGPDPEVHPRVLATEHGVLRPVATLRECISNPLRALLQKRIGPHGFTEAFGVVGIVEYEVMPSTTPHELHLARRACRYHHLLAIAADLDQCLLLVAH